MRVGIGRPPGRQDPADFVLEPTGKKVQEDLTAWVDVAADAVRALVADGLAATQDRFHRPGSLTTIPLLIAAFDDLIKT